MKRSLLKSILTWTFTLGPIFLGIAGVHNSQAGSTPRASCREFANWITENNTAALSTYYQQGGVTPFDGVLCQDDALFFWHVNALHYAAAHHQIDLLDLLLKKSDISMSAQIKDDGMKTLPAEYAPGDTPLHVAVRKKDLEILKVFTNRINLDPDQVNFQGKSSFQLALDSGDSGVIESLRQYDQKIYLGTTDKSNNFDPDLLAARVAIIRKHYTGTDIEIVENLVRANKPTDLVVFLRHSKTAPDKNYFEVRAVNLNHYITFAKSSLLHLVIAEKRCSILKMLLRNDHLDVNVQSESVKETPLLLAASENQPECIEALLEHPKIEFNPRTLPETMGFASKKRTFLTGKMGFYFSFSPLMVAAIKGNTEAFKALWQDSRVDQKLRASKCSIKLDESDTEYLSSLGRNDGAYFDHHPCFSSVEQGPTASEIAHFFKQSSILSISGKPH